MGNSANSQHLEVVAQGVGEACLSSLGFRRNGCTFRRETEPGFIHIISFGLGPSWSTQADQFTVDICVFVGEAYELFFSKHSPSRPTGMHCELCQRLGMLRTPPRDQWWSVSLPGEQLVTEICGEMMSLALPFLATLVTRRAFVEAWSTRGNESLGLPPRGDLVIAAILKRLGDHTASQKVLAKALEAAAGKPFAPFYAGVAGKLQEQ